MKLRNVSADALEVRVLGRTVEPDEVVEIPAGVLETYPYPDAWPDSLWAAVGGAKKSTEKTEKGE
jgi:hypothetical protein